MGVEGWRRSHRAHPIRTAGGQQPSITGTRGAAVSSQGTPTESMCSYSSSALVHLIKHKGSLLVRLLRIFFSFSLLLFFFFLFWFILFGSWFNLKINIWIWFGVQQSFVVSSGFWFMIQFKSVAPTSCHCCERR